MHRAAHRFVWAVWAVATILAGARAWCFGYRLPYSDDWDLAVPALLGEQRVSWSWLWALHNEHRLALPKLCFVVVDRIAGGDFRAPVLLDVALLAAAAALVLRWLARARGSASFADVVVPLLLLRLDDAAFVWGCELQFALSTALALAAFACRSGACVALLPLAGGSGAVAAVPLAAWIAATAWPRRQWAKLALAAASLALVALYLVGWHKPAHHDWPAPSLVDVARVATAYLGAGVLASAPVVVTGALAWGAIGATAWLVARAWRDQRSVAAAIGASLAAQLAVVATIAWARGGRGWEVGLGYHYAALAAGGAVAWSVAPLVYARRRLLLAALVVPIVAGYAAAIPTSWRNPRAVEERAVADELCGGVATEVIVARHIRLLYWIDDAAARDRIAGALDRMRRAGLIAGCRK